MDVTVEKRKVKRNIKKCNSERRKREYFTKKYQVTNGCPPSEVRRYFDPPPAFHEAPGPCPCPLAVTPVRAGCSNETSCTKKGNFTSSRQSGLSVHAAQRLAQVQVLGDDILARTQRMELLTITMHASCPATIKTLFLTKSSFHFRLHSHQLRHSHSHLHQQLSPPPPRDFPFSPVTTFNPT